MQERNDMTFRENGVQYVNVQHSDIIINISFTVDTPLIYLY